MKTATALLFGLAAKLGSVAFSQPTFGAGKPPRGERAARLDVNRGRPYFTPSKSAPQHRADPARAARRRLVALVGRRQALKRLRHKEHNHA